MALTKDVISITFPKRNLQLPLKYDSYHGYEAGLNALYH